MPYRLAALLIVALIFSATECAATCAFATCNPVDVASNVPPCHHHGQRSSHGSQAPCGHEIQLLGPTTSMSQDSVSGRLMTAMPAPVVFESQPNLIAEGPLVPILSPPRLGTASFPILRI
jgi:hypothetical protein